MTVTCGGQVIPVNMVKEGVTFWEGRERKVVELYTSAPLTQEQADALTTQDWAASDGGRYSGMGAILDCLTRFVQTRESTEAEELRGALAAKNEALTAKEAELAQAIQDALAGLISPPEPGEAWDGAKWYRAGDTVRREGVLYTCLVTCKGKDPGTEPPPGAADGLIAYWEAAPEEPENILAWADIENGAVIHVGQLATHNGETWRCLKEHAKSIIRQPSAVQAEYWEKAMG